MDYHYLLQRLKKEDLADSKSKFNEIKKRFIIEAKIYEKIDHPNIVKILDTGFISDETIEIEIPFIIMNYIKGFSLADVIKNEAPFEMGRANNIAQNMLGVLEVIHQKNIIHRDIKPANIMIEEETGEAIIIDFGIAKDIVGGTRLTTTGAFLGSPVYMAPEQFTDSSKVGPEIDTYALGIVLFEMLTGEPPFRGANFLEIMTAHRERPIPDVTTINPALPPGMANVLARAMAKEPNCRYQSAKAFLNALQKGEEKSTKPRRHLMRYFSLLALFIAVIGFIVFNPFGIGIDDKKEDKAAVEKEEEKPPEFKPVEKKPIETIGEDFETLKTFMEGEAGNNEKIEKCRAFLNKTGTAPGETDIKVMVSEVRQWMDQLEADDTYAKHIDSVQRYLANNDFQKAAGAAKKAQEIKDTEEVKQLLESIENKKSEFEEQNGTSDYEAIKEKIGLTGYLTFREKYPGSTYLPDLKTRLKRTDRYLPPEKYWIDSPQKNEKGCYEMTFEAHNGHRMIYVPAKKIWIDKYEVSNRQFRNFLKDAKITAAPGTKGKYIHDGNEYPAVVPYDDAEKYCKQYGFRLPRIDEWDYAAGKGMYTYPWGNELANADGIYRANFDSLEETDEKDGFEGTAPVQTFKTFSSPFGVVNMAGNVWEWAQGRILKGGGFFSPKEDLVIRKGVGGRYNDREGFRCVKDE
jgi:hypothetical protein